MRAYLSLFKLRIITNLQYRAEAIAGVATQFFFGIVYILVYLAFYESNGTVKTPMEWQSLVTYIWLMQAFFALIYPYNSDKELLEMIENGNLAYELIRPQNLFIKQFIKMFSKKLIAVLLRFLPIIIVGFLLPYPYNLSLPASPLHLIMFIISLLIGGVLVSSLIIIIHLITFFTIDSKGIITIYSVIADLFMGTVVPLPFLPLWLKKIAYVLPFRYISDFPFRIYTGDISINSGISLVIQSIIWTIIFIIIGSIISNKALKKAVIQGG